MILLGMTLAAMLLALPTLAQDAGRIPVTSRVARVVAYPDQATITRTAEIAQPAGECLLVVSGLPTTILRESVTARGSATGGVTIGADDRWW
ncbi:MAG: hypothetical protein JWO26_756 [Rhodospirillales bacterium]|nr:hypothetical protein [Rhodospirillales bacterium]MDB5381124.1 hypothetical protein [Rhodospirillales bacterium]